MLANYGVGEGQELSMLTFGALDSGFFTDSADPLIGPNRRITGFTCLAALEPPGIDIISAAK
jgi:hypothetical protein